MPHRGPETALNAFQVFANQSSPFRAVGGHAVTHLFFNSVVVGDKQVVACDLAGGSALLDMRTSTYFGLNGVGAHIWAFIQEPRTIAAVLSAVVDRYDVSEQRALEDLTRILTQFAEAGLIDVKSDPDP